ncbi:MAG: hypothetical protein N0A00_03405 [Candidatus Bathyarchaeota archaeon]|nr:hypothetical protein [Candidatus Bathyarchaeota archaeon]
MEKIEVIGMIIAVSFLGAVGNILFKIGTSKWGWISPQRFLDLSFAIQYLLTPSIFLALVFYFLGRFLMGSPLSVLGVTQALVAITVLGLVFTLALEALILNQKYDLWTYVGIVIGLVSIVLISRGTTASTV